MCQQMPTSKIRVNGRCLTTLTSPSKALNAHGLLMKQTSNPSPPLMKPPSKIKAFFELIGLCCWAVLVIMFYITILLLKLSPFILTLAVAIWFISQVL